ncbi:putative DUF676 domain-containing protein [Seiridium unicorne]|uniref:DUF676 domain-containing protein n=1 Tax=Seiridium unicorne TaxID=138068 RepID=A0ABR2VBR8_9PEZI
MAEAAGLAVGVLGLAGLYSDCIDYFNAVQQGRHLGQDYGILEAMLNNQRLRLLAWGNACGLLHTFVDELRRMTNEGVCASIENTLRHIFLLFGDGKRLQEKYGLRNCPDGVKSYDLQGDATIPVILWPAKPSISSYDRMIQTAREDARAIRRGNGLTGLARWAIEDRTKFKDLVQNIKDLIGDLETPTASSGIVHRQKQIVRDHVETIDHMGTLESMKDAGAGADDMVSKAASVRLIELRSAATEINVATLDDISSRSEPVPLPRRRQNDILLEPAVLERRASSLRSVGTFTSIRHFATSPRNFLSVRKPRDTITQYQRPNTVALRENDDSRGRRGLSLLHVTHRPFVHLILIHGLGGGSIKTWSKEGNPLAYWPKAWLPQEVGMQHANIYAYGYESGSLLGGSTDPALNIATLWESLLNDLKTTTELDGKETPLILIGHSLGGLVMKKAYILARDRSTSATNGQHLDHNFYKRVRCMFFLGTPHRGSASLASVGKALEFYGARRAIVADLSAGSITLQVLNEEFACSSGHLQIYTFFESLKTKLGTTSAMIVERNSAVLAQQIDAEHRGICKFNDSHDPNYLKLRDSLLAAIAHARRGRHENLTSRYDEVPLGFSTRQSASRSYRLSLPPPIDEYYTKTKNTCEWIGEDLDFNRWLNGSVRSPIPSFCLLRADAGLGTTVLASHVVDLRETGQRYAYYYFKSPETTSGALSSCFLSIASQIFHSDAALTDALSSEVYPGDDLDSISVSQLWKKLFQGGIFKSSSIRAQFWVIDGVDACGNVRDFFHLLSTAQPRFPLRIFMTTRNDGNIMRASRVLQSSLTFIDVPVAQTAHDIKTHVLWRASSSPVGLESVLGVLDKITTTAGNCFLWTEHMLDDLEVVSSGSSVNPIIQDIPARSLPFFDSLLRPVLCDGREGSIARHVLIGVMGSKRPLTVAELVHGVKLSLSAPHYTDQGRHRGAD